MFVLSVLKPRPIGSFVDCRSVVVGSTPIGFSISFAATRDVVAIIKGMIDAAGEHGDGDRAALLLRVKRAVLGYLGTAPQT